MRLQANFHYLVNFQLPLQKHCRILRAENQVVGWLVSYHAGSNLLRYGRVWVDPKWQKRGGLVALIAETIESAHFSESQKSNNRIPLQAEYKLGCFCFSCENVGMKNFSENHFRPVSADWVEIKKKVLVLNV